MNKIREIIIGTNNDGKYREICDLLPVELKKHNPKEFNIPSPEESGESFEKNSYIKASYFSKKTNLICLSDDSGLEIDLLNGEPGIFSSRWAGKKSNFKLAIKKIYNKMDNKRKDWINHYSSAQFICCMTLFWPNGESYSSLGIAKGNISKTIRGNNGFGYDPIFLPRGYDKTFGEMEPELKMSIDHRFKAYSKIKKFFG